MPQKLAQNRHIILFYGKTNASISDAQPKSFLEEPRTYEEEIKSIIPKSAIASLVAPYDLEREDIPVGSIAYYPVMGEVRYKSRYYFSSHAFIHQLEAAENNPNIAYHFIHVDSPGGEAFGCHEMFEAIRACKKPTLCLVDRLAASAGYYIAAGCQEVLAVSRFSEIGCIGTMAIVVNDDKYYENWGFKIHEYYSKHSPRKNKVFNDAADGKGEEYIKNFLDPMADTFISDVTSARPSVSKEALEGETFYTPDAQKAGLVDGEKSFEEVLDYILKKIEKNTKNTSNTPSININNIEL